VPKAPCHHSRRLTVQQSLVIFITTFHTRNAIQFVRACSLFLHMADGYGALASPRLTHFALYLKT
jgi:hypothetical protein